MEVGELRVNNKTKLTTEEISKEIFDLVYSFGKHNVVVDYSNPDYRVMINTLVEHIINSVEDKHGLLKRLNG